MTLVRPGPQVVTLGDIARVVGQLKAYWLGGAVLGLAAALTASFIMRPVYRASVVVMPVLSTEVGSGAVAGLLSSIGGGMGLGLGDNSQRDEALAVLKSRQFAQKLIADENMLPLFFADKWDAASGKWIESDPELIPTDWDAWVYFDRNVRAVIEDQERGLVTIRVDWYDPDLAARWANLMVARANEDLRARKLSQLESSLDFLKAELGKAQLVELRTAISQVMESQINERMLVNARPEFAFRVIDPAVVADVDQPERPKRLLMAAMGVTGGALLGLAVGLIRAYSRRRLHSP